MSHQTDVSRMLKTIYTAIESGLDTHLFDANPAQSESEFAIQNVALAFNVPNFICVTIEGRKYTRDHKSDFIEDMRMHFADNPNYIIDGMFEYHLDKPLPLIVWPSRFDFSAALA